jgi:hypothetical protein
MGRNIGWNVELPVLQRKFFADVECVNPSPPIVLSPESRFLRARGIEVLQRYFFSADAGYVNLTPIVLLAESRCSPRGNDIEISIQQQWFQLWRKIDSTRHR